MAGAAVPGRLLPRCAPLEEGVPCLIHTERLHWLVEGTGCALGAHRRTLLQGASLLKLPSSCQTWQQWTGLGALRLLWAARILAASTVTVARANSGTL